MNRTAATAMYAILALASLGGRLGLRLPQSRENCAACGCRIPPGRAGRKCGVCRLGVVKAADGGGMTAQQLHDACAEALAGKPSPINLHGR